MEDQILKEVTFDTFLKKFEIKWIIMDCKRDLVVLVTEPNLRIIQPTLISAGFKRVEAAKYECLKVKNANVWATKYTSTLALSVKPRLVDVLKHTCDSYKKDASKDMARFTSVKQNVSKSQPRKLMCAPVKGEYKPSPKELAGNVSKRLELIKLRKLQPKETSAKRPIPRSKCFNDMPPLEDHPKPETKPLIPCESFPELNHFKLTEKEKQQIFVAVTNGIIPSFITLKHIRTLKHWNDRGFSRKKGILEAFFWDRQTDEELNKSVDKALTSFPL